MQIKMKNYLKKNGEGYNHPYCPNKKNGKFLLIDIRK